MTLNPKLTVAVMQPHFAPFAGYMRLFAAVDLFVIYDCVQFTRRGRIHRNQLLDHNNNPRWLTLPLKKEKQSIKIKDLSFSSDPIHKLKIQINTFPCFVKSKIGEEIINATLNIEGTPVDYISAILAMFCRFLNLPFTVIRSSSLGVCSKLKGQFRVLDILEKVGASHYVNSPSGRDLYDTHEFRSRGIDIRFQDPYVGNYWSILQRMLTENILELREEIYSQA